MNTGAIEIARPQKFLRFGYALSIFLLTLTGFAQMPVMKRYYIADIPGFGWLAEFYVTHALHYLAGILFLGLVSYIVIDFLLLYRQKRKVTPTGYLGGGLLLLITVTGLFLVLNNFAGIYLPQGLIIFLDLCHLGGVMGFLAVSLFGAVFKKRWTIST